MVLTGFYQPVKTGPVSTTLTLFLGANICLSVPQYHSVGWENEGVILIQ